MLYILISIYLVFFGVLAWRKTEWAIYLIVFGLPSYGIRFFVGPIPVTILEAMIVVLTVIYFIKNRSLKLLSQKLFTGELKWLNFGIIAFLLSATINIFVAPDKTSALGIWKAYFIEPFLFYLVFINIINSSQKIKRVIWASFATALIIALVAVYQRFTGWHIPITWLAERRVTSIFSYPNAVGLYLAPIVVFFTGMIAYISQRYFSGVKNGLEKRKDLIIMICLVIGLILSILAIIFAKTEAALVALVINLFSFGLLWSKKTMLATIAISLVIATGIIIYKPAQDLLAEKLLLKDWSGQVRITTWKESYTMLQDHWLTGAGLAGYQEIMKPHHKAKYLEIFLYPHNVFMNFWTEIGIYGLASFIFIIGIYFLFVIRLLVSLIRDKSQQDDKIFYKSLSFGLLFSMTTIMIHGLVDAPYFKNDLAIIFWLLIATLVMVYNSNTNNKSLPSKS